MTHETEPPLQSVDSLFKEIVRQRDEKDLAWEYHRAKAEYRQAERLGLISEDEAWDRLMELWSKRFGSKQRI